MHTLMESLQQQSIEFQLDDIKQKVSSLENAMKKQNEIIMAELASIKTYTQQLLTYKRGKPDMIKLFPIETEEELKKLEDHQPYDKEELTMTVRKIIKKGGLKKNLANLLGSDIIKAYNYDGIQGKKPFCHFVLINNIFFNAAEEIATQDAYRLEMKNAFKVGKNKIYKTTHLLKKQSLS